MKLDTAIKPQLDSNRRSSIKDLAILLAPHRGRILAGLLAMGVTAATSGGFAWLFGPAVAAFFETDEAWQLSWTSGVVGIAETFAVAMLGLSLIRGLAGYLQATTVARLQLDVGQELRLNCHRQLLALAHDAPHPATADLGVRVATDVQHVEALVGLVIAPLARHALTAIVLGVLAFSLDPVLAAIALIGVPPALLVIVGVARQARVASRALLDTQGGLANHIAESLSGLAVLRSFGALEDRQDVFGEQVERARANALRAKKLGALISPVIATVSVIGACIVLLVGAARLSEGATSVPILLSFTAVLLLLFRPIIAAAAIAGHAAAGLAALSRLRELDHLAPEHEAAISTEAPRLQQQLELCEVSFGWGEQKIIENLSLRLGPGARAVLVGPNGAGKTTALMLMAGLLAPRGGRVLVDGCDLAHSTLASRRNHCAWVPQQPVLFSETVLANIALGEAQPDRARAQRAADAANASAIVDRLEHGFDTHLTGAGAELSVGERQRLCIARALYRDAPILLLDEPTASLDSASVMRLLEQLKESGRHKIVVVATHDPSIYSHFNVTLEL